MKTAKLYSANFKGVSTASAIIKHQTDSEFSHTAVWMDEQAKTYIKSLIGEDEYEKRMIEDKCLIEQWPHSGNFWDAWFDYNDYTGHTPGTEVEIWSLELPVHEWKYCIQHYANSIGERYDWTGIAHFRFRSVKHNPHRSFCSEKFIQPLIQVKDWGNIRPWNIHPGLAVGVLEIAGGKLEDCRVI